MHATRRSAVDFLSLSLSLESQVFKIQSRPISSPSRGFFSLPNFFWLPETPFKLISALNARKQGTPDVNIYDASNAEDSRPQEQMAAVKSRPAATVPKLPGPFLA
jgi:hypothetical protein